MDYAAFFSLSLSFFLLMDPIGNIPLFITILKHVSPKRRKKILIRELLIALVVILFFAFVGDKMLNLFHISESTLSIAGGIILFMIAIRMIFPNPKKVTPDVKQEPFIVPLAIPLVAGPTILAAVMIYAKQAYPTPTLILAILAAWIISFLILIFCNAIQRALKEKGVQALERLMGLILTLIAIQMFMEGIEQFAKKCIL